VVPILVAIVAGALGYLAASNETKHYQATGQVFLDPRGSAFIPAGQDQLTAAVATLSQLITSDIVLKPVAQRLGTSLADLQSRVEAVPTSGSSVITLTGTALSPAGAVALVNDIEQSYLTEANDRSLPKGTLSASGVAYYSGPSLPTSPSAPKPLFDAVIAGLLGAIVAAVLIWLRAVLLAPVGSAEQLSGILDECTVIDLTGVRWRRRRRRRAAMESGAVDLLLRAPDASRVIVVGVEPVEAPAEAAADLAVALSGAGRRVSLIDLDVRDGKLTDFVGAAAERGITDWVGHHDSAFPLLTARRRQSPSFVPRGAAVGAELAPALIAALDDEASVGPEHLQVVFASGIRRRGETMQFVAAADLVVLVVAAGTRVDDLSEVIDRLRFSSRLPLLVVLDGARERRVDLEFEASGAPLRVAAT
jgi:capsular polysaccharide biosynthesis protein